MSAPSSSPPPTLAGLRAVIVDEWALYRQGVASVLRNLGIEVVGEASRAGDGMMRLVSARPAPPAPDRGRGGAAPLAKGPSNRGTAAPLVGGPTTVKSPPSNIWEKLGAKNRQDAVGRAIEQGLLG